MHRDRPERQPRLAQRRRLRLRRARALAPPSPARARRRARARPRGRRVQVARQLLALELRRSGGPLVPLRRELGRRATGRLALGCNLGGEVPPLADAAASARRRRLWCIAPRLRRCVSPPQRGCRRRRQELVELIRVGRRARRSRGAIPVAPAQQLGVRLVAMPAQPRIESLELHPLGVVHDGGVLLVARAEGAVGERPRRRPRLRLQCLDAALHPQRRVIRALGPERRRSLTPAIGRVLKRPNRARLVRRQRQLRRPLRELVVLAQVRGPLRRGVG